jgi:hypothetical protein
MDKPKNWDHIGTEMGVAFEKQGVDLDVDPVCVQVIAVRKDGQKVASHTHTTPEMECPQ